MRGRQIPGLAKYQGRNPKGYFQDLPRDVKRAAQMWLWHFCKRWGRDLPQWRFAILVGQAKRLALNPPTSEWGRTMLAKRGGYAVQRSYRMQGRNSTELATWVHRGKARMLRDVKERQRLGLPPRSRHSFTPGNEP